MFALKDKIGRVMIVSGVIAAGVVGPTVVAHAQPKPAAAADTTQAEDTAFVTHRAVIKTSKGPIEIELYGLDAPKTVKNFIEHAKKGYYDGLLFHRVVPGFIIQTGDPNTRDTVNVNKWGLGGESIYGTPFADELNAASPSYRRGYMEGTLAMANRGYPNTNSSQFFIVLNDKDKLPYPLAPKYTIFGRVTKGLDIIHMIEKGAVIVDQKTFRPRNPVAIVQIDAVEVVPTNR